MCFERAKVTEPFGYIVKPFEDRELNSVIEVALYKHKMETKLKESEERFKNIYEQSPIGIELYDSNGSLLHANKACLEIFGISDIAEIMGFNLFEDPNVRDDLKKRLRCGENREI